MTPEQWFEQLTNSDDYHSEHFRDKAVQNVIQQAMAQAVEEFREKAVAHCNAAGEAPIGQDISKLPNPYQPKESAE